MKRRAVIVAATRHLAIRRGEQFHLEPGEVVWPRDVAELNDAPQLPLYIDRSWEGHRDAERIADYIAERWGGPLKRPYNPPTKPRARLDAEPGLPLD